MERRSMLKGVAVAATGSLAALAGCATIGGGASGEVTTNEFDNITVESHRLENSTVLGTEAVVGIVTVKNTGSESVEVALDVTMYDGETIVAADDATVDETVEPDSSMEISEAYEGRKGEVTRYEISLTETSSMF